MPLSRAEFDEAISLAKECHKREMRTTYLKEYRTANLGWLNVWSRQYWLTRKPQKAANNRAWRVKNEVSHKAQRRDYQLQNKTRLNQISRDYHEANKEAAIVRSRAYYEANKEALNVRSRAYYEANRQARLAYRKAYVAAHKEEIAAKKRIAYLMSRSQTQEEY